MGCLVELGKTQFLENGINPEITGHVKSVWKYLFLTNLSVRNNILLLLLLSWFLMKIYAMQPWREVSLKTCLDVACLLGVICMNQVKIKRERRGYHNLKLSGLLQRVVNWNYARWIFVWVKPNLNKFTNYTLNKNYTVAIKMKWFLACAIEIALKSNRNISIRDSTILSLELSRGRLV